MKKLRTENVRVINDVKTEREEVFTLKKSTEELRKVLKNEVMLKALVAEELKEKIRCC